ncbi:hypothetical protein [Sphingobium nicotianae]|uniref:Uncharacterized protein n=1 Tax=Sphingobium nicotianae TaxID=2782607 RepID=A0A9X1DFN6_9SPHN|nr:hypothetical protein [Sphingobium nicotianae]MBT2189161.1 hypothetical protein [Sphingobium nicotianae]
MTTTLQPETSTGTSFEPLFRIWMMPAQIGMELLESNLALMTSVLPQPRTIIEQAGEKAQDIARAAEEQVAHVDDGPTMVTPAALVS